MANKSVETIASNNNPEIQDRINKLGEFKIILKEQFTTKLNKDLDTFLDGELNDVDKERLEFFMNNTEPQLLGLKKQSEKENLTITEIKDLLGADKLNLIPHNIQNVLKEQLKQKLELEINTVEPLFLEKNNLTTYLSNTNSIVDKVSFIENYLKMLSELKGNQKTYLKEYITANKTENLKFLDIQAVEQIGIITATANYAPEIIPIATLDKFNNLTYEYTQTGVLEPTALQFYIQNEEGIRGIGKKNIQLREVNTKTTDYKDGAGAIESLSRGDSLIGIEKFDTLLSDQKNSEIFIKIATQKINDIDLQDFREFESEFTFLVKQIQQEHGYIPYDYLIFRSTLESVGNHLFFESKNIDTLHAKKMLEFLDMCEEWMKFDNTKSVVNISKANLSNFTEQDFQKIQETKNKIKKGEIKSFKDLEKENYITDSDEGNILQEYWNYLKDEVLDDINDPSIDRLSKKLGVDGDLDLDLYHISMADLDKKLGLINNRNGNSLKNLRLAQATDMISWNTGAKEQVFSFIETDIVKYLEKKEITTSQALQPNKEQVNAQAQVLDKQINQNVFLNEISQLSDAQKQQIVKNPELRGSELDYAVLDAIKEIALKQTASRTLYHKNILSMVKDGRNLDGMHRVFIEKHDSFVNDILSGGVDIAEMLIKEAILFAVTSVLTAGVGGLATTGAKVGGMIYTNKILRGFNAASKYAEGGRTIGQRATNFGLNTSRFLVTRSAEAGIYTVGAGLMYENQEISIDNYITNIALFAGGITGMKIGEKIIPRNSGDFTKTLSQMLGGSVGSTTALIMTEDYPDGLSLGEAGSMMAQGALMGGLMFPLMRHRGLQNKGKQLGENFANRDSVKSNRAYKSGEYQDKVNLKIDGNITNMREAGTRVGRNTVDTRNNISRNNSIAEAEINARNSNSQRAGIIKDLGNIKTKVRTGLENTKLKTVNSIKNIPDSAKLTLNKFLAENRTARLEALKKIDHTAKYNDLGNGFTLKNGKEIINRDFETVGVLPDGVQVQSVQYLNFGNKRIPILEMSDGKILRLNKSQALNGNPDVFKNILGKIQNEAGTIEGIYSSRSNIVGYKITHENGNIVYLNKNGNKPHNPNTHKNWEKNFTKHQLASNSKFTTQEIADAGLTIKNKAEIKRNFDKAFEESFPDDATFKKSILERFERIKKDPNATPEQKKEAGRIQKYLIDKPFGIVKGLMKKSLLATILAGGGVLGYDYWNDGDIDISAIGTGLAILFASSDEGLEMIGDITKKIPGIGEKSKAGVEWLKNAKNKHKTLSFLLRVGGAMVAMDYMDTKDNN